MKRRSILVLLGSVALHRPVIARAQQPGRDLRLGLLLPYVQSDPQAQARVNSFTAALQERGWIDGRNVRLEFRYTEGESSRLPALADDLVHRNVDVILTAGAAEGGPPDTDSARRFLEFRQCQRRSEVEADTDGRSTISSATPPVRAT